MNIVRFLDMLEQAGVDRYAGVPDSLLKPLCDHLTALHGVGGRHIIAANEGGAVAVAAGHYLATGRPALVYLQNSGIGNAVNPICSLLDPAVYAIPTVFVVGWRGEPGVHDEPQHVFQGEITLPLLECVGVRAAIITKDTTDNEFAVLLGGFARDLAAGRSVAFVVKKGALEGGSSCGHSTDYPLSREEVVITVLDHTDPDDIIVSTTGKLSRELFEAREARGEGHGADFLTVGSMGHASMIGLGVAIEQPERRVFVLDGDGAVLMHTGSLAVLGASAPRDLVHLMINNEAHESVGGMPTVAATVDFPALASACGYRHTLHAESADGLATVLEKLDALRGEGPVFIEVKTNTGARADLGRPTATPQENKSAFMKHIMGAGNGGETD